MITQADVRRIALSMPKAEEKSHFGRPDFRINNRIFATIHLSARCAVVKLSAADQSGLVAMDPETFSVNSPSHPGWTNVRLSRVTRTQFRSVIEAACARLPQESSWHRTTRSKGDDQEIHRRERRERGGLKDIWS
jgi:hypothetical protein